MKDQITALTAVIVERTHKVQAENVIKPPATSQEELLIASGGYWALRYSPGSTPVIRPAGR